MGPATEARLATIGVTTMGQLAESAPQSVERLLGHAVGRKWTALAWNRDPRQIQTRRRARSAGAQSALGRRRAIERVFKPTLHHLADRIELKLDVLAEAKAIIFDVRGYPTDAGSFVLRHLLARPDSDQWMHIPNIVGPFGSVSDWRGIGWNVVPQFPQLVGHRIFLTDGRAISYAESLLGYVADHDLGTIIGAATAGANGNMVGFHVPSGLAIGFTGMRVTTHDGKTSRHVVGIQPNIAVTPTIAGIRDLRDEVLDRARQYVASRGY